MKKTSLQGLSKASGRIHDTRLLDIRVLGGYCTPFTPSGEEKAYF